MSSLFKSVLKVAAPIVGGMLGGPMGAAIGGAVGGAAGGGGLNGALIGGGLGYLGGGGLGTPGTSINWTSAAPGYSTGLQTVGGTGLLGAVTRGLVATGAGGGGLAGTIWQSIPIIFSGYQQQKTLRDIEKAQKIANERALATMSPFTTAGQLAQDRLSALLGLGGETDEEILKALQSSPGYQFRLEQGQQALDRSLAARGVLLSGRALIESQRMGQGLADQTYNDYLRSLQQQISTGLQAAGGTAGLQTALGDIRGAGLAARQDAMDRTLAALLGQGG